jgi:hypothetical protein
LAGRRKAQSNKSERLRNVGKLAKFPHIANVITSGKINDRRLEDFCRLFFLRSNMQRVTQFAFRVSHDERRAIANLAQSLGRSQSDAVRLVVIAAAQQLAEPVAAQASQMQKCATEKAPNGE